MPVLSVCFSCFYTGIWDLLFNVGSERLLERWLGNYTLGSLPVLSKRRRLKYLTAETSSRTGVLVLSGPTHWPLNQSPISCYSCNKFVNDTTLYLKCFFLIIKIGHGKTNKHQQIFLNNLGYGILIFFTPCPSRFILCMVVRGEFQKFQK